MIQKSKFTKKTAFTLAEVLITLAIIGVVAVLTIPSFLQKYEEKQYLIKLKKTYSVLNQAFSMATVEYGEVENWGLTTTITGEKDENGNDVLDISGMNKETAIFKKYLQAVYYDVDKYPLTKALHGAVNPGGTYAPVTQTQKSCLRLNDGTLISFGHIPSETKCLGEQNYCGDIIVAFPNAKNELMQGKNQFFFYLTRNGIKPMGGRVGYQAYSFENSCSLSIKNRSNGRGCTAWALENDNMEYLHCTGLKWGIKTKCN